MLIFAQGVYVGSGVTSGTIQLGAVGVTSVYCSATFSE